VTIVEADITADSDWDRHVPAVHAVVSCLASRTGAPADAHCVDFEANQKLLKHAERDGVSHFVLLSAICVQKPVLSFQRAKLRFEQLLHDSPVPATVIRATAFFRSLVGQLSRVQAGKPFLLFGSGEHTACKPISDRDLARFIVGQLTESRQGTVRRIIGGPGPAITPLVQAKMICEAAGQPCRHRSLPANMFTWLRWLITPLTMFSRRMAERAEFLRIAQFYASESMLVWDEVAQIYDAEATPEFGEDTLGDFYQGVCSGKVPLPDRREHSLF
jgi:divinyl chlorophyllide a 8-vinyl-reductase